MTFQEFITQAQVVTLLAVIAFALLVIAYHLTKKNGGINRR
jgi:hypothetical protein